MLNNILELPQPTFPLEELQKYVEDGWFDEEVLVHLKNILNSEDGEKLLNGTIKPYDLFELDVQIKDLAWRTVTITSDNYSDMDLDTLKIVKERIDKLFEKAKKECGIKDTTEEIKSEITIEEAIEQLKDLRKDRESFNEEDADEVYKKDIQAIDYAITVLERVKQNE